MYEQVNLGLSWFTNMKSIIINFATKEEYRFDQNSSDLINTILLADAASPQTFLRKMQQEFEQSWKSTIDNSSRLSFYSKLKTNIMWEPYLYHARSFDDRKMAARVRCSAHKLHIETGRHCNTPRADRFCEYCSLNRNGLKVIEDEDHLLSDCPVGQPHRQKMASLLQ